MNFGKLFSFDGRVGRGAFWGIGIATLIVYLIGGALLSSGSGALIGLAFVVFVLLFVVSLATSVKRWHDRNKSGFWVLINFVPIIGGLWALIEQGFLDGTKGNNQYGTPSSGSPFGG